MSIGHATYGPHNMNAASLSSATGQIHVAEVVSCKITPASSAGSSENGSSNRVCLLSQHVSDTCLYMVLLLAASLGKYMWKKLSVARSRQLAVQAQVRMVVATMSAC